MVSYNLEGKVLKATNTNCLSKTILDAGRLKGHRSMCSIHESISKQPSDTFWGISSEVSSETGVGLQSGYIKM